MRSQDAVVRIAELLDSDATTLEELVEDVRRLRATQETFLRQAVPRWQRRVITAHCLGWDAGKLAAQELVGQVNAELAEEIAWVAYSADPLKDYSDLKTIWETP